MSFLPIAVLFFAGYFINGSLFWLHWVGLACLCYFYQARPRDRFPKEFLTDCWVFSGFVYAGCLLWVLSYSFWVYAFGVLIFSLFFPVLFGLHHLLTSRFRSPAVAVAGAFGIFLAFEMFLLLWPWMQSIGLDLFFQPPADWLCVLKFFSFKVWSALVFAACFAVAVAAREKHVKSFVLAGALVGGLAALVLLAQAQSVLPGDLPGRTVKFALVQTNLPYSDLFRIEHPDEISEKYLELASKAAQGDPDLIVFPSFTLPGDEYREPDLLQDLARTAGRPVLLATHVPLKARNTSYSQGFMNLAFLLTPEGAVSDIYQAVVKLPFNGLATKNADRYRVIRGPFGKLGILLCDEDMIAGFSRKAARDGAGVLVALSNPGLFQNTRLPYYQLFQDQIRAAETGLPLIRVSPNGYSALIDRRGRIVQRTALGTEEILQVEISVPVASAADGEAPKSPLLKELEQPRPWK